MGRLADYAWPEPIGKAVVSLYCRAYDVELDECAKASGFASFDEFFTRELRDGARTMPDDLRVAVSPADGRIDSIGPIDGDAPRLPREGPPLPGRRARRRRRRRQALRGRDGLRRLPLAA